MQLQLKGLNLEVHPQLKIILFLMNIRHLAKLGYIDMTDQRLVDFTYLRTVSIFRNTCIYRF